MTINVKSIYGILNVGQSYYKSTRILYSEGQVRDALPFLVQALEQYLTAYVIAVTGKSHKSKVRSILFKAVKNDVLLKQIEDTLNTVDELMPLTKKSMAQLADDKAQQLDKVIGQTDKIYSQIKRFVRKKYPPEQPIWLKKILGLFF
jgi:hypothetical protein